MRSSVATVAHQELAAVVPNTTAALANGGSVKAAPSPGEVVQFVSCSKIPEVVQATVQIVPFVIVAVIGQAVW